MNFVRDFDFTHPQAALLILWGIPLSLFQLYLYFYRIRITKSYAHATHLPQLLTRRSQRISLFKIFGWALAWFLLCLALMNPIGNLRYRHLTQNPHIQTTLAKYRPHEVLFLVDTSASMSVPDGASGQTRLDQAKEIMDDIIRQLHGPTVSIYSLTSTLSTLVPSTLDYLFARLMIRSIHYDEGDQGGTLYGPTLEELLKKLNPNPEKRYAIILFSDGSDNQIDELQGQEKEEALHKIAHLVDSPLYNLRFYTVGLGSSLPREIPRVLYHGQPVKSALEPELLKRLAAQGHGTYYEAQRDISWNIAHHLAEKINQDQGVSEKASTVKKIVGVKPEDLIYDLYFQIPLGIALALLLLLHILPEGRRSR